MTFRSRKQNQIYNIQRKQKKANCVFCDIDENSKELISTTKSFKIIANLYPYTMWDDHPVLEHYMIVPKKHTDTLKGLSTLETKEYIELLTDYENRGYNVLARAPQSTQKSIVHQHTHLIKTAKKEIRFLFFIHKPYLRFFS